MNKPARFTLTELRRAEKVAEECGRVVKIANGEIYIVPMDIREKVADGVEEKECGDLL